MDLNAVKIECQDCGAIIHDFSGRTHTEDECHCGSCGSLIFISDEDRVNVENYLFEKWGIDKSGNGNHAKFSENTK